MIVIRQAQTGAECERWTDGPGADVCVLDDRIMAAAQAAREAKGVPYTVLDTDYGDVTVTWETECPACNGSGDDPRWRSPGYSSASMAEDSPGPCPSCGGSGDAYRRATS